MGECIKKMREAKGLSQKEVVESGKTDPAFLLLSRSPKTMDVELIDLFHANQVFKDLNSFDKSLTENSPSLNNSTKR